MTTPPPDRPTGPETYLSSVHHLSDAQRERFGSAEETSLLAFAQVHAINAQTAAITCLAGLFANAHGLRDADLDGWAEVIPPTPLTECWSMTTRRPQCTPVHTEDCYYTDPVPEPKHVLIPVGTRVLVSDLVYNEKTRTPERTNPQPGRISGYDMSRSKYHWQREFEAGRYSTYDEWAFADNRVQVHPDGPECPSPPAPIKREPTGPRLYVQNQRGKQGHVMEVATRDGVLRFRIQWYAPGVAPVWRTVDSFSLISADQVERCPNGQTGDECGSGENQCEPCLQADDAEGDAIEESMGL
jgi:hypothetical protein